MIVLSSFFPSRRRGSIKKAPLPTIDFVDKGRFQYDLKRGTTLIQCAVTNTLFVACSVAPMSDTSLEVSDSSRSRFCEIPLLKVQDHEARLSLFADCPVLYWQ